MIWTIRWYLLSFIQIFVSVNAGTTEELPQALFVFNNATKDPANEAAFYPPFQFDDIPINADNDVFPFLTDGLLPPTNYTVDFILPRSSEFLTLGGVFPLTNKTTGRHIASGVLYAEAFKCAIVDANNNFSLLPNSTLLYQIMDTGGLASAAVNAAYLLLQRNAVSIIGSTLYDSAFVTEPLVRSSNITILSGVAVNDALSNYQAFPTFKRTIPDDFYLATAMVSTFTTFNWTLIATIFTDDEIGVSGSVAFRAAAQRARIRLTCQNTIPAGTTSGLTSFSSCISQSFSNVVVLWMSQQDAANSIAFISANPANKNLIYIAPAAWATFDNFNTFSGGRFSPSILKGSLGFIPRPGDLGLLQDCYAQLSPVIDPYPAFLDFWQSQFNCSLFGAPFLTSYFKQYGVEATILEDGYLYIPPISIFNVTDNSTDNDPPLSTAVFTYDPETDTMTKTVTLYNPYQNLHGPLYGVCSDDIESRDGQCQCTGQEYLDFMEDIDPDVNYVYDATLAAITALDQLLGRCNSLWRRDPGLCFYPAVNNSMLFRGIQLSDFRGRTGSVRFSGNNRASGVIDIFQFDDVGENRFIGFFNGSRTAYIYASQLDFPNSTIPVSEILPDEITYPAGSSTAYAIAALSGIFIALAVAFLLFFILKRKTKVVAKSTLGFLVLFHIAMILCAWSLIIWGLTQNQAVCVTKIIIGVLGYSLWIGVFAAKIMRVFQVANNVRLKDPYIKFSTLCAYCAFVIIVNAILLMIYYTADGPMEAVVVQSSTNFLYNYISCRIEDLYFQGVMFGLIFGFNGLFTLIIVVFAIVSRHVETPYEEAKYISFALYDQFVVLIVLIIIYFSGNDATGSAGRNYIIRSLGILFVLYVTLLLISAPKVYAIYKSKSELEDGKVEGRESRMYGSSSAGGYTEATTDQSAEYSSMAHSQSQSQSQSQSASVAES